MPEFHGIRSPREIVYNADYESLVWEETRSDLSGHEAGRETECGAVAVDTSILTGRTAKRKCFVGDDTTRDTLWWSDQGDNDNKAITTGNWQSSRHCQCLAWTFR